MGSNGSLLKYFNKENLENISLPFRIIGPILQLLTAALGALIIWVYITGQQDLKNIIQEKHQDLKENQKEIRTDIKSLSTRVEQNKDEYLVLMRSSNEERKRLVEMYHTDIRNIEHRVTALEVLKTPRIR